jgi:CDP-diacylglycerol--glycerol-3-phosphate 3-phosphatidyltransferase
VRERIRHLPNLLSAFRLVAAPVLLTLAWVNSAGAFVLVLGASLCTDALDGFLARRLGATSHLGARLDSWADCATFLALPVCLWRLRPDVVRAEAWFLGALLALYAAAVAFGCLKFRRLTSYHSWLSKAAAVVGAVVAVALFAGAPGWWVRVATPLIGLSLVEEMLITALLPRWRADVPSVFHALRLERPSPRTPQRGC